MSRARVFGPGGDFAGASIFITSGASGEAVPAGRRGPRGAPLPRRNPSGGALSHPAFLKISVATILTMTDAQQVLSP
jgi:hypothetical protein